MNIILKSKHNAIGIIPARMASTRLPGKPLAEISGKSMLHRVWENAKSAEFLEEIYIASCDVDIFVECKKFKAKFISTPAELPSGTDRIAYALGKIPETPDIIVNIQCDEPFLNGSEIDSLIEEFSETGADVGTLIKKIEDTGDIFNPSIVKVVLAKDSTALYFSRNPIPFIRDYPQNEWLNHCKYYKHIGIYAYRCEALRRFTELPQSQLELAEKLEQLRLLENGAKYYCRETEINLIGVDTPEDLERVRKLFELE